MQSANNASRNLRVAETGMQWEEQLTNAQGTLIVPEMSSIRVRATGATTVTIDSVLAMTMTSTEIAIICVGKGSAGKVPGMGVTVVIGGANAYVQLARQNDRTSDGQPI